MSRIDYSNFFNLNSPNNFTLPWGKLKTEFSSQIAEYNVHCANPGLSDTPFCACWLYVTKLCMI